VANIQIKKWRIRRRRLQKAIVAWWGRLRRTLRSPWKRRPLIRIPRRLTPDPEPAQTEPIWAEGGNKTVLRSRTTKRVCHGCKRHIEKTHKTAKCQINAAHVVHKECVGLLKGACPDCKGRLG